MPGKRLNLRLAKIHRSYTIEEAARLYGVHKQTVRNWIKAGLPALTEKKPHLLLGSDLREFLGGRRKRNPCGPGRLYCLRCRQPRKPAGDMLDYLPITLVSGNLRGICPVCDALMHRRVSLAKVDAVRGQAEVSFPQGQQRLTDTPTPSLDCHLAPEALAHDKAQ